MAQKIGASGPWCVESGPVRCRGGRRRQGPAEIYGGQRGLGRIRTRISRSSLTAASVPRDRLRAAKLRGWRCLRYARLSVLVDVSDVVGTAEVIAMDRSGDKASTASVSCCRADDLSDVAREWTAAASDKLADATPWRIFRWRRCRSTSRAHAGQALLAVTSTSRDLNWHACSLLIST
jgi:hypothetical protein